MICPNLYSPFWDLFTADDEAPEQPAEEMPQPDGDLDGELT
ncbi:hypothetical protein [Longispora albida]|nr:hypothetical protein [Longispora albida]